MPTIQSLSQKPLPPLLDTHFLRQEARGYLEQWAHAHWTDYNAHDPGITMLELLAYAITDLGMRTRLDIPCLLAGGESNKFFTPQQVLPNAAYTEEDFRRLLINREEVRNAWLNSVHPTFQLADSSIQLEGLYELLLDLEPFQSDKWGIIDLNEYWLKDNFIYESEGNRLSLDYYVMFPDWDNLEELALWTGDQDLTSVLLKARPNPEESPLVLPEYDGEKIFYFFEVSFTFGNEEQGEDYKPFWIHLPEGIPTTEGIQSAFQEHVVAKISSLDFYLLYQERARIRSQILIQLKSFISGHRNLTEDFEKISTIKYQYIGLKIQDLELQSAADPVQVVAQIYFVIEQFLDPLIRTYSFDELQAQGQLASDIFEGPELDRGFIPEKALNPVQRADKIYTSDLLRLIMQVSGVIGVKGLTIDLYYDGLKRASGVSNCLTLFYPEEYKVKFSFDYSEVKASKRSVGIPVNREKVKILWEKLTNDLKASFPTNNNVDLPIPSAEDLNLGDYYSIQNEFPRVYGLREGELTADAPPLRKAQAKQLKGFLLFFEQLLANYCSQLANFQELFSTGNDTAGTSFHQPLYNVPAVQKLYVEFVQRNIGDASLSWEEFTQSCNQYIKRLDKAAEAGNAFIERRNGFIDHLLARFAENFTDYAGWAYAKNGSVIGSDVVFDKLDFLRKVPVLSSQRALAFDYTGMRIVEEIPDVWETENVSGFEKRVSAKLGIPNYNRRSLGYVFDILHHMEPFDEREATEDGLQRREARFRFWNAKIEEVYRNPVEEGNSDSLDSRGYKILLNSNKHYPVSDGARELNPAELKTELSGLLNFAHQAAHYSVHQMAPTSPVCRYYFRLLGEDRNEEDPIAEGMDYFESRAETEIEIRKAIYLMEGRLTEGMHLVEHILLRPMEGSTEHLSPVSFEVEDHEVTFIEDPYSFQVSIFLPGWAPRFQDAEFRVVVERTLREEMPAHIFPWIYWVELQSLPDPDGREAMVIPQQFLNFESAYLNWLDYYNDTEAPTTHDELIRATNALIRSEHVTLTNIYQPFSITD